MRSLHRRTITLALLLALSPLLLPLAAQETPEHETHEERRVVIDVAHGGPRVWGIRHGGYLGVGLLELTSELREHFGVSPEAGVMISSVADDSPAAEADLRVGDIVTAIDNEAVASRMELARRVSSKDDGQPMTIEVHRDGSYQTLEARVESRERPQLWLNSIAEGETPYSFKWETDNTGGVMVLPSPDARRIEIRPERFDEMMGRLHERLADPDFTTKMLEFRSNTEELEERIRELEERLLALSEELERLQDE